MRTFSLLRWCSVRGGLPFLLLAVFPDAWAQPSRPFIGIFSHTTGVPSGATVAANFDANPYLAGVTIKAAWRDIEPTPGSFSWQDIDDILTAAGERGKQVHLVILPGFDSPDWVYDSGQQVTYFPNVEVSKVTGKAPLPWDPQYVALFDAVIEAFAAHLATHPFRTALTAVEISGHNFRGEEMHTPSVADFAGIGETNVDSNVVLGNWKHWIDKYDVSFPDQELILVMSQTYSGFTGFDNMLNDISRYFADTLLPSGRAILQTDQLDGRKDSTSGVTNQRCIYFNTDNTPGGTPEDSYTGADAVPNGHEMVGNFSTQPYRQGRPGMTVYNLKAMLNPHYMQIWSGNINDVWVAKDLLKEWYRYRDNTAAEIQTDLTARGLFLATTNYQSGSTAPEADDTQTTTSNGTAKTITLTYDDTVSPTPNAASDFQITQHPVFGTLGPISFVGGIARVTYTPTGGNVVDSFRWEVTDGTSADFGATPPAGAGGRRSNFAIATIEVGTVPHEPGFTCDPITWSATGSTIALAEVGQAYNGSLAGYAQDTDNDTSYSFSLSPGDRSPFNPGSEWLALGGNGAMTGTPQAANLGEHRWVVGVTNNGGGMGYATLVIKVQDTIAPVVSVTTPTNGSTVNYPTTSVLTLAADASDGTGSGVAGVQFRLDGLTLGTEDTMAPYSVDWDLSTATGGLHTLTAIARDAEGNVTTSAPVTVTVSKTLKFYPVADAFVNQTSTAADNNYGQSVTLNTKGGSNQRWAYLKFDVAGLSGQVTGLRLMLWSSVSGVSGTTTLYPVSDTTSWIEGQAAGSTTPDVSTDITWNFKPAMGSAALGHADNPTTAGGMLSVTLQSGVSTNGSHAFGLQSSNTSSVMQYHSRETTATDKIPYLEVTFQ